MKTLALSFFFFCAPIIPTGTPLPPAFFHANPLPICLFLHVLFHTPDVCRCWYEKKTSSLNELAWRAVEVGVLSVLSTRGPSGEPRRCRAPCPAPPIELVPACHIVIIHILKARWIRRDTQTGPRQFWPPFRNPSFWTKCMADFFLLVWNIKHIMCRTHWPVSHIFSSLPFSSIFLSSPQ